MKKLLLFQFLIGGEQELVAHYDMLHAIQYYCEQSNMSIKDFEPDDKVKEMPPIMDTMFVSFPNSKPLNVTKLIRALNGKPGITASTRCEGK